jgi:ABC-type uncharacterized transport system involved in gliding motility auxiliary subunit
MAEGKTKGITGSLMGAGGLLVLVAALVFVNVLFSQAGVRWDMTADNMYSLTPGTLNILSKIEEPVTLKVFYNQSMKTVPYPLKNYYNRVMDYIGEYKNNSNGKIAVEKIDPKPDSDEEEWALKYGLDKVSVQGGETMFFGLVAESADLEEIISFLDPARERFLEYEITRAILAATNPKKKVLGILSALPVNGGPMANLAMMGMGEQGQEPWWFVSELKKTYTVKTISPTADTIDKDVDLLIVVQPANLGPNTAKAIDAHVQAGKNLLVFQDPESVWSAETLQNRSRPQRPESLEPLLTAWGVGMDLGKAAADLEQTTLLNNRNMQREENPMWISVAGEHVNREDQITSMLEKMLLPVAGVWEKKESFAKGLEWKPLISTSKQSALMEAFRANIGADAIRAEFKSDGKASVLAVRLDGKFPTAFPAGGKDAQEKQAKEARRATVVLVGDTDMLYDSYYMQKVNAGAQVFPVMFNDNLNFLQNACELLTGSSDLIAIRSRGKFERPFTRVQNLASEAQRKWLEKEQEITGKLQEIRKTLDELERQKDPSGRAILTDAQAKDLSRLRDEHASLRKELKEVRRKLRSDIEVLGIVVKIINILAMPFVVALFGLGFGLYRYSQSRRG